MRSALSAMPHTPTDLRRRTVSRALATLAVAGVLAACTAGGPGGRVDGGYLGASAVSPAWREVGVDRTVFDLPSAPSTPAGETASGRDAVSAGASTALLGQVRRYDLGQIHRLVLANDTGLRGENELVARLYPRTPGLGEALGRPRIESVLPRVQPDDAWLAQQLATRFPDTLAASQLQRGRNGYGPYSYVVLRSEAGEACHFAWQRLGGAQGGLPSGLSAVHLELRHCQPVGPGTAEFGPPVLFEHLRLTFMPLWLPGRYAGDGIGAFDPAPDAIQAFGRPTGSRRDIW